jgi:hypothetical protein
MFSARHGVGNRRNGVLSFMLNPLRLVCSPEAAATVFGLLGKAEPLPGEVFVVRFASGSRAALAR